MATSGSTSFVVNRDALIKDSLIDIGAIDPETPPSDTIIAHASRLLNMMLKAWTADGLHLWKIKPFSIIMEKDKGVYDMSLTGDQMSFSLNSTLIRVAALLSDTVLEVDTTAAMMPGDTICIELDNDVLHKTTILAILDSDTVSIVSGISNTAAVSRRVYWYTNKVPRPLSIDDASLKSVSNFERPVTIIPRGEYHALSNTSSQGEVIQIYFDPQLINSKLYVYNIPQNSKTTLELTGYFLIEDMNVASNDFDIPQEWFLAVKTNLSVLLAPSYGQRSEQFKMLKLIAEEEKDRVMGWDKEKSGLRFTIDMRN